MSLYTLTTKDTLPRIVPPTGLHIEECTDIPLLAQLANITVDDVIKRLANDHLAFVAYLHNTPAAFGWMAGGKAMIGELNHELVLPIGHRYLWNFRTLEPFRGLGIYPALLQYITRYEKEKASRFWIIHAPENRSSLKGIRKAGFRYVGALYTQNGITTIESNTQSQALEKLLRQMDIAISGAQPASCWNCSSPFLKKRSSTCCCRPARLLCTGDKPPRAA